MACTKAELQPYIDWLLQPPPLVFVHVVSVSIKEQPPPPPPGEAPPLALPWWAGTLAYAPVTSSPSGSLLEGYLYGSMHDSTGLDPNRLDIFIWVEEIGLAGIGLSYVRPNQAVLRRDAIREPTCSPGNNDALEIQGNGSDGSSYDIILNKQTLIHIPTRPAPF
jgi:hypothetical protein